VPRQKVFLSEQNSGLTPHTLWTADEVGTTDSAKRNLNSLFDGNTVFDTPKPVELLKRICQIAMGDEDIALDFFAGSAPLPQAIATSNCEDGTRKRHFSVQLPEPCEKNSQAFAEGYKTISDIGRERIRRFALKLKEENPDFCGDIGFKAFKLDASNIIPWDPDFDTVEDAVFHSVENIKPDRTEADILYEILLKYGLDLAVPIVERDIHGKTVFIVGGGALVVCLDREITLETVQGIANLKDELNPGVMRVVFRDSGFKDDVVKTNTVQILKRAGIEDVKSL
jgi:adenine-specific DNA-methyltransferase